MSENSIFYYTSNYVFNEWIKTEKIWATRSITSNDSLDTVYAIKCFGEIISELKNPEQEKILKETEEILKISKQINLKLYKEILLYMISKEFDKFYEIVEKSKKSYDMAKNSNSDLKTKGAILIGVEAEEILFREILLFLYEKNKLKEIFNEEDISESLIRDLPRLYYQFVICFSYNGDDRFLWDSYTQNKGVCIEFDKIELIKYLKERYKKGLGEKFNLYEDIIYENVNQEEYIKRLLAGNYGWEHKKEIISLAVSKLKHTYWNKENEFRVMISCKYFQDSIFEIKENYNMKYKNDYKTQDYIEVELPKRLVKSVISGPMNTEAENEEIRKSGLKIKESIGTGIIRK